MRFNVKHYAEALRASVADIEAYRKAIADLADVARRFAADPTICAFFTTRATPVARQEKVLHDVFQSSLSTQAYALLRALIANHQIRLLEQVIRYATKRADDEDHTTRVHVVSATPLSARTRDRLEGTLATRMSRRVVATYEEQPAIIGGFRITIDGATQWDASVAGRLERLQERIRAIV